MNPWLRGLWDTIHFRHRCESLAAFGRRFQAESEERMERVGGLREKCIAWMYVLMFGVCLLTPLRAALAWNPVHLRCNLSSFGALCSFSPHHPFCFGMRWQLSLLVTSKEPWIIDFIAMLQRCPPTRRAMVETANDEACAQMHNAHACTPTHKQTHA